VPPESTREAAARPERIRTDGATNPVDVRAAPIHATGRPSPAGGAGVGGEVRTITFVFSTRGAGDCLGDAAIAPVRCACRRAGRSRLQRGAHGRRRSRGCLCPRAVACDSTVDGASVAASDPTGVVRRRARRWRFPRRYVQRGQSWLASAPYLHAARRREGDGARRLLLVVARAANKRVAECRSPGRRGRLVAANLPAIETAQSR